MTVDAAPGGDTDPSLADAVLFHIRLFDTVETDPDVTFQDFFVVVRTLGVNTEAIWEYDGHGHQLCDSRGFVQRCLVLIFGSVVSRSGAEVEFDAVGSVEFDLNAPPFPVLQSIRGMVADEVLIL